MKIVLALMLLLSVGGTFVFKGSLLFGIIEIILTITLAIISIFLKKKLEHKIQVLSCSACILVFLLCALFSGQNTGENSLTWYLNQTRKAQSLVRREKPEDVMDIQDAVKLRFGTIYAPEGDLSYAIAQAYVQQGYAAQAGITVGSTLYPYSERAYLAKIEFKEAEADAAGNEDYRRGFDDTIRSFAEEGAHRNPDSFELNYKAGVMYIDVNPIFAQYYLAQAYRISGDKNDFTAEEQEILFNTPDAVIRLSK